MRGVWTAAAEMNAWLDAHVGPSELEPDGMFPRRTHWTRPASQGSGTS